MDITLTEKQLINYFVDGQEDRCVEVFLEEGPDGLRNYLGVSSDREDVWRAVYDYFLFEKKFLLKAITRFQDFLTDVMTVHGPLRIRQMLQIENSKYDCLFEGVLQYIGVSREGLFFYVRRNARELLNELHEKGSNSVRQRLHLLGVEYDDVWKTVLDVLLEQYGVDAVHDRRKEHVKMFFRAVRKVFFLQNF